jgi:hypothetical protein
VSHPLDSARERLKRADENIQNLNREILAFLAPAPIVTLAVNVRTRNPIITDEDREMFEKLKKFISSASVTPRLKVLTGEIIHHLRCAFDHLAWQLSSTDLQAKSPNQIEFPVFKERPKLCGITKDKMCRYCRKIEGIASPSALARIDSLQPYLRTDASRHLLWIIHDMDRNDKHRELVLLAYTGALNVNAMAQASGVAQMMPWEIKARSVHIIGPAKVEMKIQMAAQIALNEFSGREDQPIIPTLQNFLRFTSDAIESFAEEFA